MIGNWAISTADDGKHSIKIAMNHSDWFDRISKEKSLSREVISTWDRASCLMLLAGLTDTGGSVVLQQNNTLRWSYSTGSKDLAEDVQWLVYRLFQKNPGVTVFTRNGAEEYTVFVTNNLHSTRIIKQITPYMVMDHKMWLPEYDELSFFNSKPDAIGVTAGEPYEADCFDIQVDNETSLYVLHNEGLITHNSHLGVILALEDCLRYDDVCIVVVGPTLKQTREIVAPRLRRIMADAPPGLIQPSKSEGKWYVGTSELVMGGMDMNSSAQRGKTVQNVYVEEIVDSRPDDYLESLRSDIGPALTHSVGGKLIYLTTLPKIPDHPFITETMPAAELNNALFVYTIDDNAALSQAQYDACVKRSGGKHTDDFKREYLCQIIRDRNIVIIPDFNREVHVSENIEALTDMNLEVFIDWGGVRDKTAALLMGFDYLRALDYVLDELIWPHNTPTEQIVKDIRNNWGRYDIKRYYADAPGQLQVDLASQYQFDVTVPLKSDWEAAVKQHGQSLLAQQDPDPSSMQAPDHDLPERGLQ